ncbi:MAG: hypothetical protein RIT27_2056 [Pseudomonadota bacterium]|jgi:competence protein ComEC
MYQFVLMWTVGIIACQFLEGLPSVHWFFLGIPCSVLIFLKNKPLKVLSAGILGFLWAFWTAHNITNHDLPDALENQLVTLEGRVADIPQSTKYGTRFEFEIDDPNYPHFTAYLNWRKEAPNNLQTNQRWKLQVRLKKTHGLRNENTFDQEQWFFQHRIRAQGSVKTGKLLETSNNLRFQIYQLFKEKTADFPRSGILIALILGVKQDISHQEWTILRSTGTTHLISVSGLHLSFMAFFVFVILNFSMKLLGGKWLLKIPAQTLNALLSFVVVVIYAWLAGFSIPTQRALIMIGVVFLGIIFRRKVANGQVLSLALFFVLLYDPLAVLSIGFWLSFIAIAILFWINNQQSFLIISNKFINIHTHWAIFLVLTPPLLLFFGQLPLLSIPANLIAVNAVGFLSMPLLFLGSLLSWLEIGNYLLFASAYILDITMRYLEWIATLDISLIYIPNLSISALILASVGVFLLLLPRGMIGKWVTIGLFLPAFFPHIDKPKKGDIKFDLLEVGQGLSAVIQTEHHVLVYDTAPAYEEKVIAESTLIPFLRGKGIKEISRLIISHHHFDHAGGVSALQEAFQIGDILSSEPQKTMGASYCKSGQQWEWDNVQFEMLAGEEKQYKNNSCVLKITTGNSSILLTGDIEKEQEFRLVQQNVKADILIAPHHGSKTSSSQRFVEAVKPRYALFSAGYRNNYKHPRPEIIARYQAIGTQTLNTATSGAISFQLTPNNISEPQRFRETHRRYWHRQIVE